MTLEKDLLLESITQLEALRGNPLVVLDTPLDKDLVPVLHVCLKRMEKHDKVDLLLITEGGQINAARRIGLLIREHIKTLNFLIPYRARSAGTLLCLSGDSIVMGTIGELGPLDVHLNSSGTPPSGMPNSISTEDIHALDRVAREWFGVKTDEYNFEIFSLLCQHIFPVTLGSFLRAERLTLESTQQMLCYQFPNMDKERLLSIANSLTKGYLSHDHSITRTEAKDLGLNVEYANSQEEDAMFTVWENSRQLLNSYDSEERHVYGHIITNNFYAKSETRLGIARTPRNTIQWIID